MIEIIADALSEGIEFVHQLGYQKFKDEFLPVFEDKNIDNGSLAQCYYLAANVYALHEAPLMARKLYQKSIELNGEHFDARLELIDNYAQLGDYDRSIKALKDLDPVKERIDEVHELEEDILLLQNNAALPPFQKGDLLWEMNEEIANENFDLVVDTFGDSAEPIELQVLARAFGAINDAEGYLSVWQEIIASKEEIEIDFSDWFYMSVDVFQDAEIWSLFKEALGRICDDSFFIVFETLADNYPKLSLKALRTVTCDYYIALFEDDEKALSALAEQFPLCEEVK